MATGSHQPYRLDLPSHFSAYLAARMSTGSNAGYASARNQSSDAVEPRSRSLGITHTCELQAPSALGSFSREEEGRNNLQKNTSDGAFMAAFVGGRAEGEGSGEPAGSGENEIGPSPYSTVCQAARVAPLCSPGTDGQRSKKTCVRWGPLPGCETWEIRLDELFIGQRFAKGTYGRLYQGCYKGVEVAVKFLVGSDSKEEQRKIAKQFAAEVKMYSKCSHPNVLKFIGASQTQDSTPASWCIVTEYLAGGDLRMYLRTLLIPPPPLHILRMALDIASGLEYLHKLDIVHRDLKPENLLLSASCELKVADLGVARIEGQGGNMTAETGTYRWMAPEMIEHVPYTRKVDVYSFGIILWELMTAQLPFDSMTGVQVAFAVACKAARPPLPTSGMEALSDLVRQCWDADPQKRPEFKEVVVVLKKLRQDLVEDPSSIVWIESTHPDSPVGCMIRADSAPELLESVKKKGKRWSFLGRVSKTFNTLATKT